MAATASTIIAAEQRNQYAAEKFAAKLALHVFTQDAVDHQVVVMNVQPVLVYFVRLRILLVQVGLEQITYVVQETVLRATSVRMCGAVIRARGVVALREIASERKKQRRTAKLFLITKRKQRVYSSELDPEKSNLFEE